MTMPERKSKRDSEQSEDGPRRRSKEIPPTGGAHNLCRVRCTELLHDAGKSRQRRYEALRRDQRFAQELIERDSRWVHQVQQTLRANELKP